MLKKLLKLWFQSKFLILLLISGTLAWSITMVKSGLVYSYGVGFWGPNGHDGVWHIALINSLAKGTLSMPILSGERITNYHIGFDLAVSLIGKLTSIPTISLYFQILPIIAAIFLGVLVYIFVKQWTQNERSALWSVFFIYFGSSFGWIVTLFRNGEIGGESMFWSQQAISTLINPPFAWSLIFMLLGVIFLNKFQKRSSILNFAVTVLSFGVLSQVKIYSCVLTLAALFFVSFWEYIRNRKTNLFLVFGSVLFISLVIYLPINSLKSNVLVFQPFWFLETMMGLSDRFNWPKFFSAMTNYRLGNDPIKYPVSYFIAFLIFWFGNMGTRGVKEVLVLSWLKDFRKIKTNEIFITTIIVLGGIFPMLFLQKGTPWNTIQFFYYSLFFSSLLAGCAMGKLDTRKKTTIIYIIVVVALTIPGTIGTLKQYLPSRPPAMISKEELKALDFLSNQKDGVVLTYPFDKYKADAAIANPPRPLYLYESTAYVSAFTSKNVFLEDQVNLDITGFDWQARRKEIGSFYNSLDHKFVRDFLLKNNISYVYWVGTQRATLGETQLGLVKIFENSEVNIYKVKK